MMLLIITYYGDKFLISCECSDDIISLCKSVGISKDDILCIEKVRILG